MFQATPQRRLEVRQSRLQIEGSRNFAKNAPGAKAPASSRTALVRMVVTGKNTKTAISATTRPIADTTKASPRHQPRAASPWQSSIRKARRSRAAPKPMPACRGPGDPRRAASQAAFQPLRPTAKPCSATSASPAVPAAASQRPALSRSDAPNNGRVAARSGSSDRQQPPRRPGKPERQRAPRRPERITGQAVDEIPGQQRKPIQPSASHTVAARVMTRAPLPLAGRGRGWGATSQAQRESCRAPRRWRSSPRGC